MLKNIFLLSIRNFNRTKGYALLNLLGLISGLVSFILISAWVDYEQSVDGFHEKDDRLFRVMRNSIHDDGTMHTDFVMSYALEEGLKADYPEIEHAAVVFWEEDALFVHDDKKIQDNGFYAGKDFFNIFSFPLLDGDPALALADIHAVAISASLSNKLFGTIKSVGKTVQIKNYGDFKIAGVFEDVPDNSTLQFNYVLPVDHYLQDNDWVHVWDNYGFKLYATLKPGADVVAVNGKIKDIVKKHLAKSKDDVFLQKFSASYLHSDFENGKPAGGRIEQLHVFNAVSVFMLLIAGINFINLSTALATRRAKEVGVRKVLGVAKKVLVMQFLFETSLVVFVALVAALGLSAIVLPYFNQLTDTVVTIRYLDFGFWFLLVTLWISMTLLAGLYPAIILSGFNPVQILKGGTSESRSNEYLRRGLVVIQFSISIILVIGTFVMFKQNAYILNKDLGINKDNVVQITLDGALKQNYNTFKQQLLGISNIASVTASGQNPMEVTSTITGFSWKGKNPNEEVSLSVITSDYDYLETLKMPLSSGRDFSREFPSDVNNFLVNEKAAEIIGRKDIIGTELTLDAEKGAVVGVIKDFYNATLYAPIKPLIIRLKPEHTNRVFIRIAGTDIQSALKSIRETIALYNPDAPFDYIFLDDNFERRYRREMVTGKLIQSFTFVVIVISCLGLFGLSTYSAARRSKEVGIRKVLGASVRSVVLLMSASFVKPVLLSYIVAVPVSYYLVGRYLEKFAYHIDVGADTYLLAGMVAVAISVLTTGFQSVRSANLNPVKVLRES